MIGKHKCLYPDFIRKGGTTLFLINEDQYACVGEKNYCVISNSDIDLILFMADFNIEYDIEENDVVKQTS